MIKKKIRLNHGRTEVSFGCWKYKKDVNWRDGKILYSRIHLLSYKMRNFSPLSANITKWSTHSDNSSTNCRWIIWVFDHFVWLTLKGLTFVPDFSVAMVLTLVAETIQNVEVRNIMICSKIGPPESQQMIHFRTN